MVANRIKQARAADVVLGVIAEYATRTKAIRNHA